MLFRLSGTEHAGGGIREGTGGGGGYGNQGDRRAWVLTGHKEETESTGWMTSWTRKHGRDDEEGRSSVEGMVVLQNTPE